MKRIVAAALAAVFAFAAAPAWATCSGYSNNTSGTTTNGILQALTEVCARVTAPANPTGGPTAANQTAVQANPGSDATKATAVQGVAGGKPLTVTQNGSGQATYNYESVGYTAYATPTDLFCITGSATTVVRVTQLRIGIRTTAAALQTIYFIRRSTADTGGTATNPAGVRYDSSSAAPTAALSLYTAAPTLGTSAGVQRIQEIASGVLTATPGNATMNINFGGPGTQQYQGPIVLRGTGESLCLNYNGAALTAGFVAGVGVEWTEAAS